MKIETTNDPDVFNFAAGGADGAREDLVGSGWVAEITGIHPKWKFQRHFIPHSRGDDYWYDLRQGVIYEYRNLYVGGSRYSYDKCGGKSGFFRIDNGNLEKLSESEVRNLLRETKVEPAH